MANNKLNIAIISHSFPAKGLEVKGIFVKDIADLLSDRVNVQVIAPRPKVFFPVYLKKVWYYYKQIPFKSYSKYPLTRPEYITYPKKLFYSSVGRNLLKSVLPLIESNIDVVHVNFVYPDACVIPVIKKKFPNKFVVLTIHGSDWYGNYNKRLLKKKVYRNLYFSDRIIVVGKRIREDIIKIYPEFENKIIVIPNVITLTESDNNIKVDTFKKNVKNKILMVGAYTETKGLQVLLPALKESGIKDFELVVIGDNIDNAFKNKLENIKEKLGLSTCVKFLEAQPREVLLSYYKDCDFFILPSLREGFGIVLIEALSLGKPVISTRSGGPEDIVNQGNGILVNVNDSQALARAILRMSETFKTYNSLAISKEIANKYGGNSIIDRILNVYREISKKN